MGLRCLIGHDYGETRTTRDRRQRGSEVVVTVREYRECSRCGHRRIISENKEVKAEPASDSTEDVPESPTTAGTTDIGSAAGSSPTYDVALGGADPDEPMRADEDDGIILEDESGQSPREYGQWPESGHDEETVEEFDEEPDPWPHELEEPAGADGMTRSPGPESPDADDEASADEPTEAASEPAGTEDGVLTPGGTAPAAGDEPAATGPRRAEPQPRPDNAVTELVCPDCGETWPGQNASLRPGDICPECRAGYLEEQVIQ